MGHAFVIAEYGGHRLLDSIRCCMPRTTIRKSSWITARELGRVDAIFFTHHHLDHMLPATLLQLPHGMPVFVPAASGRPLTPRSPAAFLALMGFRDVRELRAGDMHEIGGGLAVQAVPFTGEGSGVLGFDACAYVVSTPAGQALFHADAHRATTVNRSSRPKRSAPAVERQGPDRRGLRHLVAGSPVPDRSRADRSARQDDVESTDWLREVEFCDCAPEFLEELVRAARARLFVTYAEGNEEGFLPTHLVSAATPMASFLWRPRAKVCSGIEVATGVRTVARAPWMRIVIRVAPTPPSTTPVSGQPAPVHVARDFLTRRSLGEGGWSRDGSPATCWRREPPTVNSRLIVSPASCRSGGREMRPAAILGFLYSRLARRRPDRRPGSRARRLHAPARGREGSGLSTFRRFMPAIRRACRSGLACSSRRTSPRGGSVADAGVRA